MLQQKAVVAKLTGIDNPVRSLGFPAAETADRRKTRAKLVLHLVTQGFLPPSSAAEGDATVAVLARFREAERLLQQHSVAPIARRLQLFLNSHFPSSLLLPLRVLTIPEHGLARELSFPPDADSYTTETMSSYRVLQGVLHNPQHDKRTTQGSFHIAEGGGLPISADKISVPKHVFAAMLREAFSPPDALLQLPFAPGVRCMVQLLLRPEVSPEVPGQRPRKTMETLVLAPGSLCACLDFVESVFGNAGDPFLPENDAALDADHWSGHTGLIVVAPHLTKLKKKALGLPSFEEASERQRADGMCWRDADELYNGGRAFKLCFRTTEGVICTILGDVYFGYMKKEVKTQLSFSSNLAGLSEEEHSGGTLALPSYSYGLSYDAAAEASRWAHLSGYSFSEAVQLLGDAFEIKQEGYAVDRNFPRIFLVPEDAFFSLEKNTVTFNGGRSSLRILPGTTYVLPSGFKLVLAHHPAAPAWRLIGTEGRGTVLHKPTTVSGGGKSELSKSIEGAVIYGRIFVGDPEEDFKVVDELLRHDFSRRFRDPEHAPDTRPLLSESRSLGSVIKLLSPSPEYSDDYNAWLRRIPPHVYPILFYIKRFHKESWGSGWRSHFSTDLINGTHGHELKFENRRIMAGYIRIGHTPAGLWRTFKTRIDFVPSRKIQLEDDISAAITVPTSWLGAQHPPPVSSAAASVKIARNCEFRLFQRPDDCVRRGADAQCEFDLAQDGSFIANFEPLHPSDCRDVVEDVSGLEEFSPPMRSFLERAAEAPEECFVVCSDRTRLVGGKPTANPRYLQTRPDALDAEGTYLAELGMRLALRVPMSKPLVAPVDVTLLGRRISKPIPGSGMPNLAVFNPLHFQELPELLADLFCCISGTSPSTTGAGSEGALTKGPFNAMPMTIDLNNAFVSYSLTGLGGWSTPTGMVGPLLLLGHDASFLSPEVFSRMKSFERDPKWLETNGYLERVQDFEHGGKVVLASRLGLRITRKFMHFLGRVFEVPNGVFEESILRPELQSIDSFADGVNSIVEAQRVIAGRYFEDTTVELLCPPLRILCGIMAHGSFEGMTFSSAEFRKMFSRDAVLQSAWYRERLETQQLRDIALHSRNVAALEAFLATPNSAEVAAELGLEARLSRARAALAEASSPNYIESLVGTIGADPIFAKRK